MPDSELDRLLSNYTRAKHKLWLHARAEHRIHSPRPDYPTEYMACMREPCKTVREAVQGDGEEG
jgi:hypothetical protein